MVIDDSDDRHRGIRRRGASAVFAIPWPAVVPLLEELPPWHGRILVDATASAAGARVVKTFCTLPASVLALPPATEAGRRVMFLSGDDEDARAAVGALIDDIGYAAVDLGSLSTGSALPQPGGPLADRDLRLADDPLAE